MMREPLSGLSVGALRHEHRAFVARLSNDAFAAYSSAPRASVDALIADAAVVLVAAIRDRPVGFAALRIERHARSYGPIARPVIAHLDAIAVTRAARRLGVGSALVMEIDARAAAQQAIAVYLRTAIGNSAARRLFEAHGYRSVARYAHAYLLDQSGLVMMKPLP
jgi:ribosomal protein S18 acetylase RimI-like enzyme